MIFFFIVVLFSAVPKHPLMGDQVGGGITIIKIVGLLAFFSAMVYTALRGYLPPLLQTWPIRLFLMLSALALVSYLALGDKTDITLSPFMSYVSYLILLFVTMALVDSQTRLRYSTLAFIGAPTLAALYTLREWELKGFQGGSRPGYVAGDANYYAANAILALALAYFLCQAKRPLWERAYSLCCAGLIVLAMVASASRGGFFALCLCGGYIFIRSKRKLLLAGCGLFLTLLLIVSPSSPIHRILHPDYGDTQSSRIHRALWVFGLKQMIKHPIMGIGLGQFKPTVAREHGLGGQVSAIAHNTYIEYGAELGILGLILFLAIIVSTWISLERIRNEALRRQDEFFYAVSSGMQTGLLGFCVAAFFLSAEYLKTFWIMIFLCATLPRISHGLYAAADLRDLRVRSISRQGILGVKNGEAGEPEEKKAYGFTS